VYEESGACEWPSVTSEGYRLMNIVGGCITICLPVQVTHVLGLVYLFTCTVLIVGSLACAEGESLCSQV